MVRTVSYADDRVDNGIFYKITIVMIFIYILGLGLLTLLAILGPIRILFRNRQHRSGILIGTFIILFSLLSYYYSSGRQWLHYLRTQKNIQQVNRELTQIKDPREVVSRLTQFLNEHPRRSKGWYLLGRLYLSLGDYEKAAVALEKAHRLKPMNNDYSVDFAQAFFFLNHNTLNERARHLLLEVIHREPNHINAHHFLGMDAYNRKDYRSALKHWGYILPLLPENSEERDILLQMIARVQEKNLR